MNPFGLGGWSNNAHNDWSTPPSVFGALPSLPIPRSVQPDSVTFTFTNFNTTILNCAILGPQSRVMHQIVTESLASPCTILKDNEGRSIAMIKWQPNATIEIQGVTGKQRVRDWLRLSTDQSKRMMNIQGNAYAWTPIDGYICLYKTQTSAPKVLARIAKTPTAVFLEMTQEGLALGLLEASLMATVMLVCGHNID